MQSLRSALYFLLLVSTLKAQTGFEWYPIRPAFQYHYKADTSALPLSVMVMIDSVSNNAVTPLYHLNKVVLPCDTCLNSRLTNDFYDSTYTLVHQPQFLEHSFSKIAGNGFYFRGPHPFVVYPQAPTGFSWVLDTLRNINAVILARTAQPILGSADSLVLIRLSGGDTLIYSKALGIIQFPFKTIASHHYRLVGYEGATSAGIKLKRFHDFFNFDPGDVLQYVFVDDDYNSFPPILKAGRERWDFLSVNVYADSVCCKIRQTYLDSLQIGGSTPVYTAFTATINMTFADSVQHPANAYPLQEITVNPYFLYNNGTPYIHRVTMGLDSRLKITKSFGQTCPYQFLAPAMTGAAEGTAIKDLFINRNSSRIIGRELAEGLGFTSELFNNYAHLYQRCLAGYIKGSDSSGTVYAGDPLAIRSWAMSSAPFKLYPNPAGESVTLAGSLIAGTSIQLTNALGVCVQTFTLPAASSSFTLPTVAFANGVYFVVISGPAFRDVKKLIIQH